MENRLQLRSEPLLMADDRHYPVIVKCEDLAAWLLGRTAKFPRMYRASLCARIEGTALDLLSDLARAARSPRRRRYLLETGSEHLNALRILVRLSVRMKCLSRRQYEHFARESDEVGRMLGGWLKSTGTDLSSRKPEKNDDP